MLHNLHRGIAVAQDIVCGMTVDGNNPGTLEKTFLGRTFYFCCNSCVTAFSNTPVEFLAKAFEKEETALDFVCGTTVVKSDPDYVVRHKGLTFYFCSFACKDQFENNPREYVGG
ncbi:MAG: YHS domain-containing protein [Bacteroidota bacterium]